MEKQVLNDVFHIKSHHTILNLYLSESEYFYIEGSILFGSCKCELIQQMQLCHYCIN